MNHRLTGMCSTNVALLIWLWASNAALVPVSGFLSRQSELPRPSLSTVFGRISHLSSNRQATLALSSSSSSDSPEAAAAEEAERLKEQAQKLREEIEAFQQKKDSMEEEERQKVQAELDEKQAYIDRYSAVVPILKPDGSTVVEQVQFPPRLPSQDDSNILVFEAGLPLGILLGEHETIPGMTQVDEVAEGTNGQAAGILEGDLLRACTACKVEMSQPTWQLIAGGIGQPKTVRFMFGTDDKPFEQVMEALGSNRMDPEQRAVLLVVERPSKAS